MIGGACSGKSSVCQTVSRWTGVPVFDMDEHVYGDYMGRYSASRHPASSAWFKRGDGLAWVLSLPWEAFDDLNRATNAEFLDLVSQDVAERYGDRPVLVDGGITHPSVLAAAVDPSRIACLAVADAESRRIWEEDEARSGMREAREQGIAVFGRTPGVSVEALSRVVMRGLDFDAGGMMGECH